MQSNQFLKKNKPEFLKAVFNELEERLKSALQQMVIILNLDFILKYSFIKN